MKRFIKLSLAAAVLAAVFTFASCSNGSNSDGNNSDNTPGTPASTTTPDDETSASANEKKVAAVETSGSVAAATTANGSTTATLTAENGSYIFTESATANANIASRAAEVDSSKGGIWTFTEKGASCPKYSGTYKGDISKLASAEVKLSLTIKTAQDDGILKTVITEADFSLEAATTTFTASIPEVSVGPTIIEITEYALNSKELNNKMFKTKSDNGGDQWVIFTDNKCYTGGRESDALTLGHPFPGLTVIRTGGKLYKAFKFTRISGEGLFATFNNDDLNASFTIKNDGTATTKMYKDSKEVEVTFTVTDSSGVISFESSETGPQKMLYDGKALYNTQDTYELTYLKPYIPNNYIFVAADKSTVLAFSPKMYVYIAKKGDNGNVFTQTEFTVSDDTLTFDGASVTLTNSGFTKDGISFTQISGNNGFGGKGFAFFDKSNISLSRILYVFETNESVLIAKEGITDFYQAAYTVNGKTASATIDGKNITFTLSENNLAVEFDSESHIAYGLNN